MVQLQTKYGADNFQVLAFPCNQFNQQEPKTNAEVKAFASKFSANFPMFAKLTVNQPMCAASGDDSKLCAPDSDQCCPLNNVVYTYLKSVLPGDIEWNFAKFLVGRDGVPVKRYSPHDYPLGIAPDIETLLSNVVTHDDM